MPISMVWRGMNALPLVLLAAVFAATTQSAVGDILTACYDGSNKTIDIHCGLGSLVRIINTFYGFSQHDHCSFTPGDCTLGEQQAHDCVGFSSCTLALQWVEQGGVMLPQCHQRSNYFQVEYECVPKTQLQDICQRSQMKRQSGHIITPQYPLPYYRSLNCNVTIVVAPSQKLRLNIITMELTAQGKTDCADWLYFNDKFHSLTLCGRRSNIWYDMHSNFLHIELQSTNTSHSQGFWLYYQAYPPLSNTSDSPSGLEKKREEHKPKAGGSPDSSSVLVTTLGPKPKQRPRGPQMLTPIPVYRDDTDKSGAAKSLPFAAIAGGVIGTLSLVLIILLMLLLIKWLKERRYFRDEKFLEIKNPAFRSSGDFNEANSTYFN